MFPSNFHYHFNSYLCLDHVVAFVPHLQYIIKGVHHLFLPRPLQLHIDGDEAASSTYPCAAVDQERLLAPVGVRVTDPPQEVEQGGGVTGDAKVRP